VRKSGQKFIFHIGFVAKLNDEHSSLMQEVPHHVLIAAGLQRDSDHGRERSQVNGAL
jgi:hypothetical protein